LLPRMDAIALCSILQHSSEQGGRAPLSQVRSRLDASRKPIAVNLNPAPHLTEETMPEDLEAIKHAPAGSGVEDLILRRWSPRSFADKAVSDTDLTKIFTAASWAASSANEQPWRFLVGKKGDGAYEKIFNSLVGGNQAWARSAPVLILSVGKKTFSKSGQPNGWALHDTGAASANLTLQATALGLHTHGMAGFDKDKARASFNLPEDFEPGAVWALGYLGDPGALPERLQAIEKSPRERKPLHEFVFTEWGTPAAL
jgi:nitroreductase